MVCFRNLHNNNKMNSFCTSVKYNLKILQGSQGKTDVDYDRNLGMSLSHALRHKVSL